MHPTLGLIGGTPLVEMRSFAPARDSGVRVLAKIERMNPFGSVKDRVALAMIEAAERDGRLAPGGVVIEPTSGNTGIGLAGVAALKGYRLILTMPETMSVERRMLLSAHGAELVLTPGAEGMKGAIAGAKTLAERIPGAFIPDQFSNPANPRAHYDTTGPEIYGATDGEVDILIAGVGTGGTISGTAKYLQERKPSVLAVAVEPAASPVLSGGKAGAHKIQGIGAGFVPANFDHDVVDEVLAVTDAEAFAAARLAAAKEGILVGVSAGAALHTASVVAAREAAAGKARTIVVIIPDSGERYLSSGLFETA